MTGRKRLPFSDSSGFDPIDTDLMVDDAGRAALTPELEAVRAHAAALVAHERRKRHDPDLCAKCLLPKAQQADLDRCNADQLNQIAAIVGHGKSIGCPPLVDDVARLTARATDAAAFEAGRWPRLNAIETFVGRVAQQPCVFGRKREDGPCPAYERAPATHAADPVANPLDCPPCAARRLMADMEPVRRVVAQTTSPGCISDEELRRLALGFWGDSPVMIIP